MNINLHIDRLVLEGVAVEPRQRPLLQQALQNELTSLLGSGGLAADFARSAAVHRLTAPGIHLSEGKQAAQLGQQIAQAVYGSIGRE